MFQEKVQIEGSTWCYWVSLGHLWLVLGGTGSVLDGTVRYFVLLGHGSVLGRYWLVLGGTGSVWGGSG